MTIRKYTIRDGEIGIPVTYHPYVSTSVQVHEVQYFKIIECEGGKGTYTQGQISIIIPNNPTWKITKGRLLVEISKCADLFDESCVLYTNYIWNNGINIVSYSNITFDISSSNDTQILYMRVTSRTFPTDYTFEYTYVSNNPIINGVYDYDVFGTSSVNGPYLPVAQYIQTSSDKLIENFEIVYFFVQFCVDNYINSASNWQAHVQVASSTSKPKSAFEIWGCSFDDGTQNCSPAYNDGEDLSAVAIVAFSIQNDQDTNLNDGFYIGMYGIGGELDSVNGARIFVTTSFTE